MCSVFEMQEFGQIKLFLGVNTIRSNDGMYLNQSEYIEKLLNRFHMPECHQVGTPINTSCSLVPEKHEKIIVDEKPVKELIGSLNLSLFTQADFTQADICATINLIARYQNNATERHHNVIKGILKYLNGTMDFAYFMRNAAVKHL